MEQRQKSWQYQHSRQRNKHQQNKEKLNQVKGKPRKKLKLHENILLNKG